MQGWSWQGVRRVGREAVGMGLAAGVVVLALACSGEPTAGPPVPATVAPAAAAAMPGAAGVQGMAEPRAAMVAGATVAGGQGAEVAAAMSGSTGVRQGAAVGGQGAEVAAATAGSTGVRQGAAVGGQGAEVAAATAGSTAGGQGAEVAAAAVAGTAAGGQGVVTPAATVPAAAGVAAPGSAAVGQGATGRAAGGQGAVAPAGAGAGTATPKLPPPSNISSNNPAKDEAEPGGGRQTGDTAEAGDAAGAGAVGESGAAGAAAGDGGCCESFNLGGQLTAAAWLDADRMYLADYGGRIRLLNVATGEIKTVWEGLTIPQGLTVLEGRLYGTDMGNVCDLLESEWCKPRIRGGEEAVLSLLARSNAWILSFAIDEDGELSDRRIEVDGILSLERDHSANGLTNDGEWIYASIGHPYAEQPQPDGGFVEQARERLAAAGGRTDLMGTIARFKPGDEEVEVYATGLRNTYGIAIAPDGTIYGVDNDALDGRLRRRGSGRS